MTNLEYIAANLSEEDILSMRNGDEYEKRNAQH